VHRESGPRDPDTRPVAFPEPLTFVAQVADAPRMFAKRLLVVALVPYVIWLIFAYEYHFIDGVNLAFHEAGHLFFSFLGQTLHVLGGTIGQLFFPAACCAHFLARRQSVEAAICCIWFAESLMYTARYLADARAQVLPLVGGHIHDWNWLLLRAGLLDHCETIGTVLHVVASIVAVAALVWAARSAFWTSPDPAEVSRPPSHQGLPNRRCS
jgi:hypothetical protein